MFLKRIELQGFKSFADKTVIEFDSEVTGIVGPNGCGKSNVNDAIRWVLGEQSAKSLRGGSMSDVIFSGSASRKAVNMAEVTLVFDNSRRNFDVDFEEVSVTRRLFRNSGEGEYMINKTPCRLKDITNMVMDSGLGRDSLSVISQGNISEFVESKPEDRRALFEEAAGVAKYKKRKNESLNKLNRTQDNLTRIEDIVEELQGRVNPLKRQAKKATQYLEYKEKLESIEISVIVDEVQTYNAKLEESKKKAFEYEAQRAIAETTINVEESKNDADRSEMRSLDKELHTLQQTYHELLNKIASLNAQKTQLDEKRRYRLESANNAERAKELKVMLNEAEYEYQDRLNTYNKLKTDQELNEKNLIKLKDQFNEIAMDNSELTSYINKLNNRKEVLNNLAKSPFEHQEGVKTIIEAKDSLFGIYGVTSQLLKPIEGYEQAISYALGGAIYHIISEDEDSARHAITYLKKNRGGRATFLPISVLKEHLIDKNDLVVAENMNGFLGVGEQFVDCDEKFDIVALSLLGNVLVCDNLVNANSLAKILKYKYKIVTLEGDIVHKGGSMSGGKIKGQYSPLTITKELKQIEQSLEEKEAKAAEYNTKLNELSNKIKELSEESEEINININRVEPILEVKKEKFENIKNEYNDIKPADDETDDNDDFEDDLLVNFTNANKEKEQLDVEMKLKRERRYKLGLGVDKREDTIRSVRHDLNILSSLEKDLEINKAKDETKLDNYLNRLSSDYELTYEHACELKQDQEDVKAAREEVLRLRNEINKLGNVNLDAPKEFEEVNERYTLLTTQRDELVEARNKILTAIDEMDEVMSKQFKEMFDKINNELDGTFKTLFGGGKARLYLTDPDDILNSGVEINVSPPGKRIANMQQLSGGEKSLLAMCVLFSIMKARVMPLCIFDEVEAALDQSNVEKFARYIANFKGESQFLVVTHRPGTMAQCDALYGVTMQQDGVSKFLKVKLKDALNYINEEDSEVKN